MRYRRTFLFALLSLTACASSPDGGNRTSVELARSVHFEAPDGGDVVVPAGAYSVAAGEGAVIELSVGTGEPAYRVRAEVETHEQALRAEVALALEEGEAGLHLHLLRPDRIELEAIGFYSGVRSRGWARKRLPRPRVQQATSAKVGRPVRIVPASKSASLAMVAVQRARSAVMAAQRAARHAERTAGLVRANRQLYAATRAAAGTSRREAAAAQRAAILARAAVQESTNTEQLTLMALKLSLRDPGNDPANLAAVQRALASAQRAEEKSNTARQAAKRDRAQAGQVRRFFEAAKEATRKATNAAKESIRRFHEAARAQAERGKKQAHALRDRAFAGTRRFVRHAVESGMRWAAAAASVAARAAAMAAAAAQEAAEAAQEAAEQAASAAQDAAEAAAAAAQAAAAAAQAAAEAAAQAAEDAAEAVEDWVGSWF
jgi:hypothetical protein